MVILMTTPPGMRLQELIHKLKKHGHRITPQRISILKILATSEDHPSVENVYEQIKQEFPTTSLATVYKTVALLKEEGEILELTYGNNGSRYDGSKPYPHPHLICIKCQRIIDPDTESFSKLHIELARQYGYQIVNHRLDFFGICPACQESQLAE
jgi:Fur family transcriptional regulator, peroxide stress response regulator